MQIFELAGDAVTSLRRLLGHLRQKLPIFHRYDGMPWCSQDINGKLERDCADEKNSEVVAVTQTGEVHIMRRPDDTGRQGCYPRQTQHYFRGLLKAMLAVAGMGAMLGMGTLTVALSDSAPSSADTTATAPTMSSATSAAPQIKAKRFRGRHQPRTGPFTGGRHGQGFPTGPFKGGHDARGFPTGPFEGGPHGQGSFGGLGAGGP